MLKNFPLFSAKFTGKVFMDLWHLHIRRLWRWVSQEEVPAPISVRKCRRRATNVACLNGLTDPKSHVSYDLDLPLIYLWIQNPSLLSNPFCCSILQPPSFQYVLLMSRLRAWLLPGNWAQPAPCAQTRRWPRPWKSLPAAETVDTQCWNHCCFFSCFFSFRSYDHMSAARSLALERGSSLKRMLKSQFRHLHFSVGTAQRQNIWTWPTWKAYGKHNEMHTSRAQGFDFFQRQDRTASTSVAMGKATTYRHIMEV